MTYAELKQLEAEIAQRAAEHGESTEDALAQLIMFMALSKNQDAGHVHYPSLQGSLEQAHRDMVMQ